METAIVIENVLVMVGMYAVLWLIMAGAFLHILALLGFGQGMPFTSEDAASQRFYRGDLSVVAIILSALFIGFMTYISLP